METIKECEAHAAVMVMPLSKHEDFVLGEIPQNSFNLLNDSVDFCAIFFMQITKGCRLALLTYEGADLSSLGKLMPCDWKQTTLLHR